MPNSGSGSGQRPFFAAGGNDAGQGPPAAAADLYPLRGPTVEVPCQRTSRHAQHEERINAMRLVTEESLRIALDIVPW